MAVRNIAFGSTNGNNEVDLVDLGALVLIPFMVSFLFQVTSFQINVFGGYDLTAPIWTVAGIDISASLLVVIAGVAWIFATNLANTRTDMEDLELAAVATALLLPILYVFVPAVESLIMWHDTTQLAATLYVSAASVYASYVS
ncbi:hypothetical protein [Halovivax cerinus]|uniref:Yip1 domain-containing protein n=1 Tax=Halovivax cerinus TaxID=1487865 RepID=A0ABD5NTF4_9EURY|nr:hypothetical protein [Halovivax cerinus]